MRIERSEYTGWDLFLEDGSRFRLYERNARLEISAREGTLAILPTSSNVVELAIHDPFSREGSL
ncbi:hypothetical protein SEA_LILMAC1015_56 [Arthrobacter phage Lilmac1015]|uniref:Uncharacterized protein n=1 Tax=Arthrobacter phage Lilmac1015 TaxID=2912653 RepID=A0AA49BPT7_9CAUD|nr:hypothetical protein SEA_LILMAC1015_56 [Arthrobacter phage Lilmac1015]